MVLIFNVAPILGVRCKQNVDERNPSLSLPSCLCRVCVLPIICPHESSRVRAQHLFGSLKSAHGLILHLLKLCSPATVYQERSNLWVLVLWVIRAPGCHSNGQCYKKINIHDSNLKSTWHW